MLLWSSPVWDWLSCVSEPSCFYSLFWEPVEGWQQSMRDLRRICPMYKMTFSQNIRPVGCSATGFWSDLVHWECLRLPCVQWDLKIRKACTGNRSDLPRCANGSSHVYGRFAADPNGSCDRKGSVENLYGEGWSGQKWELWEACKAGQHQLLIILDRIVDGWLGIGCRGDITFPICRSSPFIFIISYPVWTRVLKDIL